MSLQKILIVDDEPIMRTFLEETLKRKRYSIDTAENGQKAYELLQKCSYDLIISDLKMPQMSGIELLQRAKEISPSTLFLLITAYATVETAVEAMKKGAFNYLLKPFSADCLEAQIALAEEHLTLLQENQFLRQEVQSSGGKNKQFLLSECPSIQPLLADVQKIAESNSSVLITGESGTGKEVIAHAIHFASRRAKKPFIKVNCAAIPDALIESEFFGYEKGAFTGANTRKVGRFELANHGTLLLDEISEIPLALQAKLLRALQEQEFERLGGSSSIKVDVRILSTSNRLMQEAIQQKLFREDLYYRLAVIPLALQPLRERRGDILPLARHFYKEFSKGLGALSSLAEEALLNYSWPGNIRELSNVIERMLVLGQTLPDLPARAKKISLHSAQSLEEIEKSHILETLSSFNNNKTRAAHALGISVRTLRNKLISFGLSSSV